MAEEKLSPVQQEAAKVASQQAATAAAPYMGRVPIEILTPPPDHEITEEELNAMSLTQLADMIASNTTTYDGLTLTNRNALVRLLRATTEAVK
jgi:galactose-1-phosphate uridylyltransferase